MPRAAPLRRREGACALPGLLPPARATSRLRWPYGVCRGVAPALKIQIMPTGLAGGHTSDKACNCGNCPDKRETGGNFCCLRLLHLHLAATCVRVSPLECKSVPLAGRLSQRPASPPALSTSWSPVPSGGFRAHKRAESVRSFLHCMPARATQAGKRAGAVATDGAVRPDACAAAKACTILRGILRFPWLPAILCLRNSCSHAIFRCLGSTAGMAAEMCKMCPAARGFSISIL